MFRELSDGSAVVYGISIKPFVQLQHMQIDVTTINRLANYSLAFARERGYLQTDETISRATRFAESNDARPLVEQEGYAHRNEDRTVFYAGVDVQLSSTQPHFHRPAIPSTVMLFAKLYISHVGRSSYNVKGTLYTYVDDEIKANQPFERCASKEQEEQQKERDVQTSLTEKTREQSYNLLHKENRNLQLQEVKELFTCYNVNRVDVQDRATIFEPVDMTKLGQFMFTCVRVSSVLRIPILLSPRTREVLTNHCKTITAMSNNIKEETREKCSNHTSTMTRIDVKTHVARSKILDMNAFPEIVTLLPFCHACNGYQHTSEVDDLHENCNANCISRNETSHQYNMSSAAVQSGIYCRTYALRESDIDFNKHVNQLATMHMVINTFRSALRDKDNIYCFLLAEDVSYLIGDLLLRRLRIDYVREIPFSDVAMEIYLFPMTADDLEKLKCTREHARLNELAEIGFFTIGVSDVTSVDAQKANSKQQKYISTVGILTTPV